MEKRKVLRSFTASSIELSDLDGNFISVANVCDISKGGILVVFYCVEKSKSFVSGEKVRFKFNIPSGEISGTAVVAWSKQEDSRIGLKFAKIENENGVSNLMAFVTSAFLGE